MSTRAARVAPWAVAVAPGLLWWLACLPGNLTFDSVGSLGQIATGDYWNNHPVAYTLMVQALTLGGSQVWLLTLVQALTLTAALVAVGRTVGASRWVSALVAATVMALPYGGPFAVTVWKDVPFTIGVLLGFAGIVTGLRLRSPGLLLGATLALAVGAMCRHNGWTILVAAGLLLLAFRALRRDARRGLAALGLLLIAAVASIGLNRLSADAVQARPLADWFTTQTVLADLAYAQAWHPDEMPPGLDAFVATYAKGASFDGARECSVINGLVYGEGFDAAAADAAWPEAARWYGSVLTTAPQYLAQARLCRAAAVLPPPLSLGPRYVYVNELSVYPNELGIHRGGIPVLAMLAERWDAAVFGGPWGRWLAWPGLLGLLGTVAVAIRTRNRAGIGFASAAWAALIWGSLGAAALVSVAQDFRYGAPAALVGLALLLVPAWEALSRLRRRGVAASTPGRTGLAGATRP